jgi:thymidine kinase
MNENKFSHPVYQPVWLKFMTPEVISLDSKIKQWIYCGITGAIILGDARSGKTTASEILSNTYASRSNGKPILSHRFTVSKLDKRTIANCIRRLYVSIGGKEELSNRASDKYLAQILDYFTDLSTANDEAIVLLFIDESQRLSIEQLDVFADLQNSLRDRKVTILIYLIGNLAESKKTLNMAKAEEYD